MAEPAVWGTERHMNALETLMWRAEADPRMRATTVAVELLDTTPEWGRLLAAHDWGTRFVTRARERVLESPFPLAAPSWVADEQFDLSYHLRRVSLPAPGDLPALLELAQTFAMTPFDRGRPPWEAMLVEGLTDGRAAYLVKLHHSLTDGTGGIQLLSLLHSRTREHNPDKPTAGTAPSASPPSGSPLAGVAEAATRLAGGALGLLARPERAVSVARSLQRVLGPAPAPPSPLLAGRSLAWRFLAHEVPLASLKAAAVAAGGSVNDAFLAALLGAFRLYHVSSGVPVDVLPVAFPISLRADEHAAGGNRFAGARMAGPVGEADPVERIRLVREFVLTARAEPAGDALTLLAPALSVLPGTVLGRLSGALTGSNDLQASNIRGVGHPVYLAGARVTHLYPFGPRPNIPAMITMVSHDGTCCVGANLDPAAVTDVGLFARCLRDGFDEVLAIA
jgi:diacylglycerol O-acyltransferase / wax synthase